MVTKIAVAKKMENKLNASGVKKTRKRKNREEEKGEGEYKERGTCEV